MKEYPHSYIEFLIEFHATRDYFECHEILEDYWKEEDRSPHWPVLIQLAVAVYHERQRNDKGSFRLYKKVSNHLQTMSQPLEKLAIDVEPLKEIVNSRLKTVSNGQAYKPLNLPLTDELLINHCKELCEKRQLVWARKEDLEDDQLVYRHKLRNRH